ncbi:hypothetical protein BX070DRAFT_28377 [Coemansia spiralis]|nr:hypothetical protein BX070DRAFT_28377 [Coemansia spiralis]
MSIHGLFASLFFLPHFLKYFFFSLLLHFILSFCALFLPGFPFLHLFQLKPQPHYSQCFFIAVKESEHFSAFVFLSFYILSSSHFSLSSPELIQLPKSKHF